MTIELHAQLPDREDTAIGRLFQQFSDNSHWDTLRVAVAYASIAGLLHFLDLLNARSRPTFTSYWLFGLDDFLTQPGVLRTCLSMSHAELRLARLSHDGKRFHPKLMMVSEGTSRCFACVGSSNLTIGGLSNNCESVASVTASTPSLLTNCSQVWQGIWDVGIPATEEQIDEYERSYNLVHPQASTTHQDEESDDAGDTLASPTSVLTDDTGALDPSLANTCWIEVGNNTAKGYELEFKAEQALFFDLSPSGNGGAKQYRTFIASSGAKITLPLRYQPNGMWRLQMNSEIPEVAAGLRPRDANNGRLLRSPYVAVFARSSARSEYFLTFITETSTEYRSLRRQSSATGTLGRTSARHYGWC